MRIPDAAGPLLPESRGEGALTALVALLGIMPVMSLLAWVYQVGALSTWFWLASLPSVLALIAIGIVLSVRGAYPRLRSALVVGAIAGVLGTLAYDAVREPQNLFGLRPYLPIQSYGLLILDTPSSSPLTEFTGWAYNFSNGVGFAITYAVVAWRRRWYWGVAWAMVLESATIFSPFAAMYAIAGHWDLIGLAYVAHLFYGVPLGKLVQSGPRTAGLLHALSGRAATVVMAAVAVGLLAWQQPWRVPAGVSAGRAVAPGAAAVIQGGRFQPQWLRIAPGACAIVRDDDATAYTLSGADGSPTVAPGGRASICSSTLGIVRVRTSSQPDAGGILLVDWSLRP
jgi:hypothetical protein